MPGKSKPKPKPSGARPRRPSSFAAPAKRSAKAPARQSRVTRKASVKSSAADARRAAILAAALDVFSRHGFTTARLDDVAAKAGIAKGTLYLYFKSKEALFEELIRGRVTPLLDRLELAAAAAPPDVLFARFFELFRTEILGTERKLILQLLISEGARFPAIAEFYHREVVSRGMALIRSAMRQSGGAGTLGQFPQLIVAPLILALVWDRVFGRIDPIDVEGMLAAYAEMLKGAAGKAGP